MQGNTPRRENRHHCSVSMVFMVHTPRCFWSTSARDRNKAERFQRLSCLLVIPTPSLALQTVQHKVKSLGRHSVVATVSMFLASSSSESSIVSLLQALHLTHHREGAHYAPQLGQYPFRLSIINLWWILSLSSKCHMCRSMKAGFDALGFSSPHLPISFNHLTLR